ncbi:MAG: DUF885 domain-containing protein [Pyrinomonadaceae bacterium]|nr:DUF885 domain-containing protein [Pyrinomonadaceae bacterium]
MPRKFLIFIFILTASTTMIFANSTANLTKETADQKFEKLANDYIAKLLELSPEYATQLGEHRYDNRLGDYSLTGIKQNRAFNESYLTQLKTIPLKSLSKVNSVDARIMRESLEYAVFQIDVLRDYETNPLTYNVGSSLDVLISRDFAPLKERLTNLKGRLEAIPNVVAAAKANLKNPSRIHTETAIAQNQGVIGLIKNDLQPFLDLEPTLKSELAPAQTAAINSLEGYGKWLKEDLLPRSNGDYRLGEVKYRQKLKFALSSDLSKEELLKRAEADLKLSQNEMYNVALPLYKQRFPNEKDAAKLSDKKLVIKAVLDKLAESRPNNETIVARAKEGLQQTTDFVRKNRLVTVPTEPIKIVEMPEYARGTAVAYCDSTGVFEKNASTIYAISPTPKDWTAQRAESFFKEYNDYMLQDLTIHEAMPGHYLQLMHANEFNAPTKIRAIFSSGSFVEGWAVYSEQLMAEKGYGGADVKMQQLKMKLRVIINSIIDQKIHTANMTEKEAIAFMMNEGFQEEGEAAGKWKRAQLSSTQLSTYYVGSVEVNDIRRAYEAKNKGKVDMLKMHDDMLSFGSPAAKYVKEMLGL